ncbi:putative cation antiporter subunit protein [Octadecabacter antarcticus 307]|uniref:Putative cation antiporter subunit protein n=1 Tax=Octadecabacter antarcticus 307 TaxID=391626 RepID=M9RAS8_9RHOB|nr:monovalent cation/H(+) antiporter subunit G [Octadecabacter antarcticus]AGI68883.1 putative cation antiporter subunit protein [Octadecabacter antarcticus 307]
MTVILDVLGLTLMAFGVGFLLIAALAVWRLPDALSRLHALTKADSAGLTLIALGAVCLKGRLDALLALGLCVVLVALSGATLGHLIARSHLPEDDIE